MRPPTFLQGHKADGGLLWASIEPEARYVTSEVAERRFAAYMTPFMSEQDARQALLDAGAQSIAVEAKRKGRS